MEKIDFKDIPQFFKNPKYKVDIDIYYVWDWIQDKIETFGLELNPDFQRGVVWSQKQQQSYIEYVLSGGGGNALNFYFNSPEWQHHFREIENRTMVCVDGLQRLSAILAFLNNKLSVFDGHYFKDFTGYSDASFRFYVNDLVEKNDVINWYIQINTTGTQHTKKAIDKARQFLI